MDKEEILKEIEKTKKHLVNMEKMLEECNERWKPKTKEEYYYVDDGNDVKCVNFSIADTYDRDRIKAYNYFQTWEQAEAEAEKILVRRMLEDIARRLNKGMKIDWYNEEQTKYSIQFNYYSGKIALDHCFRQQTLGVAYCLDRNFKDVAIKEIGEERLIKYLEGK